MGRGHTTSGSEWLDESVFSLLPKHLKADLVVAAVVQEFSRRQLLTIEGSQRNYLWAIQSGFVLQTKQYGSGREATVAILGPRQIVGILGFWTADGFRLSSRALTGGSAIGVPVALARKLCEESSEFALLIGRQALARLDRAYDAIADAGHSRVEQRILAVLTSVGKDFGKRTACGMQLEVPLTRQDIADLAHTTVETAIRTLRSWEKAGYLATHERQISILDLGGLRSFVAPADG
ncbi:MAG: Crp/Fnr family transcriptional regulator [Fimbriimonadaceae bacterium]